MPSMAEVWKSIVARRTRVIALFLALTLLAPSPAKGQFQLVTSLIGIVNTGLGSLNNSLTSVNNTLRDIILPILQGISGALSGAQQNTAAMFDHQRNVVYPQGAIDSARVLTGQVLRIYAAIRGIWNSSVRSATLPNPQRLEDIVLSKDVRQVPAVSPSFSTLYTPLPAATEAHPRQRDVIDSADAVAQAAMKRSISIDAIADQELAAAEQMMSVLQNTAPGTAEMIGAQAGAWLVRSHAYTQQAMAELMRVRAIELATQSARFKESARYASETRGKLMELNR